MRPSVTKIGNKMTLQGPAHPHRCSKFFCLIRPLNRLYHHNRYNKLKRTCQSNMVYTCLHSAERRSHQSKTSDGAYVGVPWLCRWFKPSRGSEWCIYRQRHIDISRQVSDKSNAALEGELSTMTVHWPWKEKLKKTKTVIRGSFGINIGVQTQQVA